MRHKINIMITIFIPLCKTHTHGKSLTVSSPTVFLQFSKLLSNVLEIVDNLPPKFMLRHRFVQVPSTVSDNFKNQCCVCVKGKIIIPGCRQRNSANCADSTLVPENGRHVQKCRNKTTTEHELQTAHPPLRAQH